MEDTYRSIEAINRSSFGIAAAASMIALLLIVISYFYTKKQKSRELTQQQLLEQTAKAAEAANKAKSTFLFNMSHDIRTPMNAILGYAELARNHLQEPEKIGEYMDKIHISGEKMLSIINNILQFSQIENNQIHIEETSVQTEKSFDSCIVMVQTALEEKQQHFHVTKDISYPYIYIDMTYMSEIILNILSNAIKYTAKGGTISCALRQEPGETDGWCITEIAITDTGIGISEEFQSHIFESFSRERSSTVSGIEGTGLGMGIVKNLVDLMHGTIEVKSKLGEGSTFTVRIPCRISSREETEPTAFDETAAQTLSGCRILLAEDNDLNAEISISSNEAAFGCDKLINLSGADGSGKQTLKVHIPAGIDNGKSIRLRGKGNPGYGGAPAGDLLLKVHVGERPGFERKGTDVYTTVNVPFITAALGGEAKVQTLNGQVMCRIPEGTQSGSKIRLKGKGIQAMGKAGVYGDLYVTVQVQVPRNLSEESKRKLREFDTSTRIAGTRGSRTA